MNENKTRPTGASVAKFIAAAPSEAKRRDAERLDAIFRQTTGMAPQMWGPSIIGYGRYAYRTRSGREGEFLATGFSPRKAAHSIYIMPGYADFGPILSRLGKHRMGKACLYVNKLADVDEDVLAELIRAGLDDLAKNYEIHPR